MCLQDPEGGFAVEDQTEAGLIESIVVRNFKVDPSRLDTEEQRVCDQGPLTAFLLPIIVASWHLAR